MDYDYDEDDYDDDDDDYDEDDEDDYMDYSWEDYDKYDDWPIQDNSLLVRFKRWLGFMKYRINNKLGKYDGIPF